MAAVRPVRGTRDYLPADSRRQRFVETTALAIASRYGYGEISTPIFEFTEVFARTLGDTSDIVTKEMYTLADRSGESLTLRPENTAGVVRAVISNGLAQQVPLKYFYRGPMFRYERPQKGRLRQFNQVGIELLGVAEPGGDIECIALAADFLSALGLEAIVNLEINTLGDPDSRRTYTERLVGYLEGRRAQLSEDSRMRLERNPLRVLDSKDEGDRAVVAAAPSIMDSLNETSRSFFAAVRAGLDTLDIRYTINPKLVRGLDYYCHTAFEFTTEALGAQGTVLAGGRYDGLAEQMGGRPLPGIGWAAGVERAIMLVGDHGGAFPDEPRPLAVVPQSPAQDAAAQRLARELRRAGLPVDIGYAGSIGKRLKRANRINARAAIIVGEDELARDRVAVRDLDSGIQEEVALAALADGLVRFL
ncbi:MAG: histidine--tRNA ligase [Rhodospirillales bacterium]|nr:histidine--tRNA ligase [Rhodospirillales bacterium]